jgi:hypothetical protein
MSKKKLRKQVKALKRLIKHAWVHSGYPSCGYGQMATGQKKLYCKVIGCDYEEFNEQFFDSNRIKDGKGELQYGIHPDGRRVFPMTEQDRRAGFVVEN